MVNITTKFRLALKSAMQKFDYTSKMLAHDLGVRDALIYAILNGHVDQIQRLLFLELENWMSHDKKKSMAERLLFSVEYKKMMSDSCQTKHKIMLQLNGSQNDLLSDADNAANFLENDFSNVDTQLAHQVLEAKTRQERLGYIQDYRTELVADYGKTLMAVPDEEPRLLALQLANRMLS